VHVILAVLGFVSIIRVKAKTVKSVLLSVLVLGLFSIFMMLPSSSFVWDAIPKFSFIQYPWRFLSVTGFSLAVLSAGFLYIFPQKKMQIVIFSVAILGIIGMNMKWFHPQSYTYLPADSYESINDISWRVSKISDEYLPTNFSKPKNQSEVPTRPLSSSIPVSVTPLFETAVRSRYVLEATQAAIVVINTAGFPGWVYYLNDDEVKATIKNGLPSLMLGPGQTIFEMRLKNTNVRIIANILTIISLIALGGLFYGKQTSKKR
jgi:hypothetical protein